MTHGYERALYFLPFDTTLQKTRRVRQMIEKICSGCEVEVDGGIDADSAPLAVAAGATVLVAGTAIFGESEEVAQAMDGLRASIKLSWKEPQQVK
jgi:ribulose-phosphate 3-epimerase